MGIRVKLRIVSEGQAIEASALLNTGFEGEMPEVLLPLRAAERLGLWPILPKGTEIKFFATPGGTIRMHYIPQAIEICVITKDKSSQAIKCSALISELESEILLNDKAIGELGLIIENAGKGLWRFLGEGQSRESELAYYWL